MSAEVDYTPTDAELDLWIQGAHIRAAKAYRKRTHRGLADAVTAFKATPVVQAHAAHLTWMHAQAKEIQRALLGYALWVGFTPDETGIVFHAYTGQAAMGVDIIKATWSHRVQCRFGRDEFTVYPQARG